MDEPCQSDAIQSYPERVAMKLFLAPVHMISPKRDCPLSLSGPYLTVYAVSLSHGHIERQYLRQCSLHHLFQYATVLI